MAEFTRLVLTEAEKDFYSRLGPKFAGKSFPIPWPGESPRERTERRCAFRNQRRLYKRTCDLSGEPHVTLYHPDMDIPVYSIQSFWGDGWDACDFGQDYDPGRPFFEQLAELYRRVPRLGMMNRQCENSEYCNYSYSNKNCYLVFSSHYEEDCFHGNCSARNKDCSDYHWIARCELCYECFFCENCYESVYLDHCGSCYQCWFCYDCRDCKNCLFSANLRHKQYCIFNEQLSKDEYYAQLEKLKLQTYSGFSRAKQIFQGEMRERFPFRAVHQVQCENCEGTDHSYSRNIEACFQADTTEDTLYSTYLGQTYDCVDVNYMGFDRCELSYQCIGCTSLFHGICCDSCWHCAEINYSSYCFSSRDCFGCMSLKNKQHCILNKQYSKDEYEKICAQILESMSADGSWGKFFPIQMSAFGYNETVAQDWFPRTRDSALESGYGWRDLEDSEHLSADFVIPEDIGDVSDEITDSTLVCSESGRAYKMTKGELKILKKLGVPVHRLCPDVRQSQRLSAHSPWDLWTRECAVTGKEVRTTYSPERPEIIYSLEAYSDLFDK